MFSRTARSFLFVATLVFARPALADGPKDNIPDNVRPIPPLPTRELSADERAEIDGSLPRGTTTTPPTACSTYNRLRFPQRQSMPSP